jgi:hypothetical protein
VYLLYVDESGKVPGVAPNYFVLAGLAVHEASAWELSRSIDGLVQSHLPSTPDIELHATQMWSARREWSRVPKTKGRALLRQLVDHLVTWRASDGRAAVPFAVAVHKRSFVGQDAGIIAHQQLITRFDSFLTRLGRGGPSQLDRDCGPFEL